MRALFAVLFLLGSEASKSQTTVDTAGPHCANALRITNNTDLKVLQTNNGKKDPTGDFSRSESPGCFDLARQQTVYLWFMVREGGTLEFEIDPINNAPNYEPRNRMHSEYDWALYPKSACSGQTFTNWKAHTACNFYDNGKQASEIVQTGMRCKTGGPDDRFISDSLQDAEQPFSNCITVNAGQEFILLIDNFSADDIGFTIKWGGSFKAGYPLGIQKEDQNVPLMEVRQGVSGLQLHNTGSEPALITGMGIIDLTGRTMILPSPDLIVLPQGVYLNIPWSGGPAGPRWLRYTLNGHPRVQALPFRF